MISPVVCARLDGVDVPIMRHQGRLFCPPADTATVCADTDPLVAARSRRTASL
jgi:hypothetical protein